MKWVYAISLGSLIAVLATIDGSGQLSTLPGPGITLDESFNIDVGWFIVRAESEYGLAALSPTSQMEIFGFEGYNPDHPPLGRLFLGLSDALVGAAFSPEVGPGARWSVTAARVAPAIAYALTVLLVGWVTFRWTDRSTLAAVIASTVFATTPRVFGHAHIASLESFIGMTFAACVFYLADQASKELTTRNAAIGGALWGLALLTKIQAVLIPIPFAIWGLWHFRQKAILPGAVFGVVGMLVFVVGWPWLWLDPVGHLIEYFGRGSERIELNVFFAGEAVGDRHVSLFYTVVMFLLTFPLIGHALAIAGLDAVRNHADSVSRRRWHLIVGTTLFVLLFFTLPNIAVYDGVRLFLVAFPLWATLAGIGASHTWRRLEPRISEVWRTRFEKPAFQRLAAFAAFLPLFASGPFWLSHYNAAVGFLPGANRLGFEASYWGDSLTRSFWQKTAKIVPEGSTLAVAPVLHQFQLGVLEEQVPVIRRRGLRLVPFTDFDADSYSRAPDYLVVFRRRADITPELDGLFDADPGSLVQQSSLGVELAILVPFDRQSLQQAKQ